MGGGPPLVALAVTDELISVDDWLDDWVIRPGIVIRELIHEVGNKDAAHTDDDRGPIMNALESNQTLVHAGGGSRW